MEAYAKVCDRDAQLSKGFVVTFEYEASVAVTTNVGDPLNRLPVHPGNSARRTVCSRSGYASHPLRTDYA